MKLTKELLANAFALSSAILWILCSAFVWIFPQLSLDITRWWSHGLNIDVMGAFQLTFYSVLWGGVALVVSAWVTGYVFGWVLEALSKTK